MLFYHRNNDILNNFIVYYIVCHIEILLCLNVPFEKDGMSVTF